jgi:hypothetical protein
MLKIGFVPRTAKEMLDPLEQGLFQALDLRSAAGDDGNGTGVLLDARVELVDDRGQFGVHERPEFKQRALIVRSKPDIALHLLKNVLCHVPPERAVRSKAYLARVPSGRQGVAESAEPFEV